MISFDEAYAIVAENPGMTERDSAIYRYYMVLRAYLKELDDLGERPAIVKSARELVSGIDRNIDQMKDLQAFKRERPIEVPRIPKSARELREEAEEQEAALSRKQKSRRTRVTRQMLARLGYSEKGIAKYMKSRRRLKTVGGGAPGLGKKR